MKRILINATQNEEIRVALCKGNHLYDFDLENRTREQKKSNIYKGHVTRVEPSLEAVFVEYGSQRQGFLPIREISSEYLSGNPRDENIKKLIKEGDELIVQVEKEERGNKGAALSTYVSLAGRYLVLMPNNPRGGGISRQISGKLREDMKRMLSNLDLAKGMSVIIRTAGIGKTQEDLQHDLNHLLNIWQAIQEQNQKYPSPRLVHQEAGVVTRAVRDYLRDDIAEIWIDNENAYIEAAGFIDAVMPKQAEKLRKYTDYEPMFSRFNIEKQIETAYQREVRLPSGGSIVIDQTEALVSIDINSAKSTKGSDVAETAYHTNLEAADEIARQLRLRDMGGLIVIDFIDMNDNKHQKEVEKRLIDATKYDRARVQFGDISKFGLMEMSRQRLRPSLEESTGYICPRCHGNGMIRDLRSLSLSIMRQIEQIALKERQGEVQAEVPTDIAAFLLNEKRDSLVYLEQDSGTRITILPHAHLESPNFKLHFNRDGFAPTSYERITDTQQQEHSDLGYNVDWQTAEKERPEQQPTRQPRHKAPESQSSPANQANSQQSNGAQSSSQAKPQSAEQSQSSQPQNNNEPRNQNNPNHNKNGNGQTSSTRAPQSNNAQSNNAQSNNTQNNSAQSDQAQNAQPAPTPVAAQATTAVPAVQPQAVAWLSNLFAQAPQAQTTASVSSRDAAEAIEALVNTGAQSLGSFGQVDNNALSQTQSPAASQNTQPSNNAEQNQAQQTDSNANANRQQNRRPSSTNNTSNNNTSNNTNKDVSNETNEERSNNSSNNNSDDRRKRQPRKSRSSKPRQRRDQRDENDNTGNIDSSTANASASDESQADSQNKREPDNTRNNDRNNERNRNDSDRQNNARSENTRNDSDRQDSNVTEEQARTKRKPHSQRSSRGKLERGETLVADDNNKQGQQATATTSSQARTDNKAQPTRRNQDPNEVMLQVNEAPVKLKAPEVVHLSLDDSKSEQKSDYKSEPKSEQTPRQSEDKAATEQQAVAVKDHENNKDNATVDVTLSSPQQPLETTDTAPTDEQAQTAVDNTANQAQVADIQPESSDASEAEVAAEVSTETQAATPTPVATTSSSIVTDKVETVEAEAQADVKTQPANHNALPETATTSSNHAKVDSTTTVSDAKVSDAAKVSAAKVNDDAKVNDSNKESESAKSATLELTHEALFASRYVTANKFGQASNDPRVVRRQQAQSQPSATAAAPVTEPVIQQAVTSPPAIRSTVGEFIHATLPEAQTHLADNGIIRSFIEAIAIHTQQAQNTDGVDAKNETESAAKNANADNDKGNVEHADFSSFTFSNYGYQPLKADYLARFSAMTQAVSQFAAVQGKTAVEPRAISKRASNDPRGQHPDYSQQTSRQAAQQQQAQAASESVEQPSPEPQPQTDSRPAVPVEVDAHDVEAAALTGQDQAANISADSEQLLQVDQQQPTEQHQEAVMAEAVDEPMMADASKEDSQAGKSKTTIASYKNMIENVAEQLLPQMGMFNLTTPKVPKARSRKPKTEHKKPTQAEIIEANDSDNES